MTLSASRTPERQSPFFSGPVIQKTTPTEIALSTSGGAGTMTVAQMLCGILMVDTQDAQTLNTPTAADIIAALPGCEVGSTVFLIVVNHGDSTLTVAVGTGVTQDALASTDSVLTLATVTAKLFAFRVTGIAARGDAADAVQIYAFGAWSAAVS